MTGTIILGGMAFSRSGLNSHPHLIPFNSNTEPFNFSGTFAEMISFVGANLFFALIYVPTRAISEAKQIPKTKTVAN